MSFHMAAGDVYGGMDSARDALIRAGVSTSLATLAVPAMFWTPAESDPSSNMTILVVQGAQRALKRLGFALDDSGRLDSATQGALARVAGRSWGSRAWIQIYGSILEAESPSIGVGQDWLKEALAPFAPAPAATAKPGAFGPAAQAIYGSLPYGDIACLGTGSKATCQGKTARVRDAFQDLQVALGVGVDGKIGSVTARAAISKIEALYLTRFTLNMKDADTNILTKVRAAWTSKSQSPLAVAAYADKLHEIFVRYGVTAKKPPLRPTEPTIVELDIPPPPKAAGIMDIKMAGIPVVPAIAIAGLLYLATRKGGAKGKRRAPRRRPTPRRRSSRRRR